MFLVSYYVMVVYLSLILNFALSVNSGFSLGPFSVVLCHTTSSAKLNEQVAYKRGVAGPKKWRPKLIIVKMAV